LPVAWARSKGNAAFDQQELRERVLAGEGDEGVEVEHQPVGEAGGRADQRHREARDRAGA
jgi:hypothetical protein